MRTKLPPATGSCTWLADAPNGNRQLEITVGAESHIYEVVLHAEGGFDLLRTDFTTGELLRYRIRIQRWGWECNCPDATHRPERRCNCKHSRALRAALAKLPF